MADASNVQVPKFSTSAPTTAINFFTIWEILAKVTQKSVYYGKNKRYLEGFSGYLEKK